MRVLLAGSKLCAERIKNEEKQWEQNKWRKIDEENSNELGTYFDGIEQYRNVNSKWTWDWHSFHFMWFFNQLTRMRIWFRSTLVLQYDIVYYLVLIHDLSPSSFVMIVVSLSQHNHKRIPYVGVRKAAVFYVFESPCLLIDK